MNIVLNENLVIKFHQISGRIDVIYIDLKDKTIFVLLNFESLYKTHMS